MAIFNSYVKLPEGTYIGNAGVIIDDLCAHGELGHHKFGTLHDLARNKSRN
jgi:hypothetical protein